MTQLELDTIKLTAQFVAKNQSKHFLQKLTQQEARNPRFDFLKPTHQNFAYFTTLIEQYSRVLLPRSDMLQRYRQFAEDPISILKAGA
jgi:splicing factor 3A subunit 1